MVVAGTLERRLLAATTTGGQWLLADLSGQPHDTRNWPTWAQKGVRLHQPSDWLTTADLSPEAVTRLTRPRILLAALYRPEYFPLPRFPLATSVRNRRCRPSRLGVLQRLRSSTASSTSRAGIT
ncbi:hypothetical protein Misp03_35590 [Microbispora sp. NBRC 16548]|nr:hypothetical protein Misp03_35590 [Microbispora sp. NBRC 16548]